MSEYVMVCYGFARDIPCPFIGQFLEHFDPTTEVKGAWTNDLTRARKFASKEDAFEVWRTSIGTRSDGKPDRPLTAFSVGIQPVTDFEEGRDAHA
jgi:hypothetical protein